MVDKTSRRGKEQVIGVRASDRVAGNDVSSLDGVMSVGMGGDNGAGIRDE